MANFVKCKQEFIKVKETSWDFEKISIPYFVFFKKEKTVSTENPGEAWYRDNVPINIDVVITISKNKKKLSKWDDSKPGILFNTEENYYEWYYDDEKVRNEQFDEIVNNHHNYKSNISI